MSTAERRRPAPRKMMAAGAVVDGRWTLLRSSPTADCKRRWLVTHATAAPARRRAGTCSVYASRTALIIRYLNENVQWPRCCAGRAFARPSPILGARARPARGSGRGDHGAPAPAGVECARSTCCARFFFFTGNPSPSSPFETRSPSCSWGSGSWAAREGGREEGREGRGGVGGGGGWY